MENKIHAQGFHHVAIKVSDFDRSFIFYTEGLGFEAKYSWGTGDGRGVLIDTGKENYFELFAGGVSGNRPEGAWFHMALACTDTDAAIERVKVLGCPVTVEPTSIVIASDPPLHVKIAFFTGPDGESIELFEIL
jgi:glyoxylase I family protein